MIPNIVDTCPCCGNKMTIEDMQVRVKLLQSEFPDLQINSGYRCESHNKAIGGGVNSAHLRGLALDIQINNSTHQYYLIRTLLTTLGAPRLFLYRKKNIVHVDWDLSLPYPRFGLI